MNPMTHLVLAAVAFLATHYISSTPLRAALLVLHHRLFGVHALM